MQSNRFNYNRLDDVKTITKDYFINSGLFEVIQNPTSVDNTLKFDEDKGGVFVWSNQCNQYFLVGKFRKK